MMRSMKALARKRFCIVTRSSRWIAALCISVVAACTSQARYPEPPMNDREILIDAASLPAETPQFYTYRTQGRHMNFFLLRLQNKVLSFLDACITCSPRKLGYHYADGFVTCRACDTSYSIYKLEQGIGGCFPIRIDGSVKNGTYVIARSTLDRHAGKF